MEGKKRGKQAEEATKLGIKEKKKVRRIEESQAMKKVKDGRK